MIDEEIRAAYLKSAKAEARKKRNLRIARGAVVGYFIRLVSDGSCCVEPSHYQFDVENGNIRMSGLSMSKGPYSISLNGVELCVHIDKDEDTNIAWVNIDEAAVREFIAVAWETLLRIFEWNGSKEHTCGPECPACDWERV